MDWPSDLYNPANQVISTASPGCHVGFDGAMVNATFTAAAAWPAANRAIGIPFIIEQTRNAQNMVFYTGASAGNYDIGIYNEKGKLMINKGTTAVPAAGIAVVDITDTLITPGLYFMTAVMSTVTTLTVQRSSAMAALWLETMGVVKADLGSTSLPDPITFVAATDAYLPLMGVVFQSTL